MIYLTSQDLFINKVNKKEKKFIILIYNNYYIHSMQ